MSNDLICTASNAFPSGGSITWYNNNDQIQRGVGSSPNGDRFDVVNTLRFTPMRQNNKHSIKCEVRHETLTNPAYLETEAVIDVTCKYILQITSTTTPPRNNRALKLIF